MRKHFTRLLIKLALRTCRNSYAQDCLIAALKFEI